MTLLRWAPMLLGILLLIGCGGGGGDEADENVLVRVVFPGPTGITDRSTIQIRGIAPDPSQVTAVSVEGVAATSNDGFATWKALVPLTPGMNDLRVDVTDPEGEVLFAHVVARVLSVGHFPLHIRSLALDVPSNRLYYIDARHKALVFVDLRTGLRTIVSDATHGIGVAFEDPEGLVLDLPRGRAFVAEGAQGSGSRKVVRVSLGSGNRAIVAHATVGNGPPNFSDPESVVYDALNDRVIVVDESLSALIEFDPDNGDRTEITRNGGAGSGDNFVAGPFDMVADIPGDVAYVTNRSRVFEVTLSSGARSILSDDDNGVGDDMQTATGIVFDGGRLVVGDEGRRNLIAIDMTTGDRTILSSRDIGSGPLLERVCDVENQATAGRVFAADQQHRVFDVDLSTGNRAFLFEDLAGTGEAIADFPSDVSYDRATGAVFVLARDADNKTVILRVSPVTQERRLLSGPGRGDGPAIESGAGPMTLDGTGRKLYVFDSSAEALYAVDIDDGDRELVSGLGRGAGTNIESASDLLFDPVSGTVLLVASNQDHIVEIDPETGNRTTLSDNSPGQGNDFSVPHAMTLDRANHRILVLDNAFPKVLYAVDRTTGVRTVVTDANQSTGIFVSGSSLHLDAANNRVLMVRDSVTSASSPTTNVTVTAIDLTTGRRSTVSAIDLGSGPNPMAPRGGDYDPVTNRLFTTDHRFDAIFVYDTTDPESFDRAVLTR